MKKILFLLLCTVSMYGQTYQNPTFGTVKLKTNTTSTTATNVSVQETDGSLNKMTPTNLPITQIPVSYIPTAPTLGGHISGIDNKLNTISATTAGQTTRVWFTADQTTITAGTFDLTNPTSKGTAPSHIQSVVNDDNQKKYFTTDVIGGAFIVDTMFPPGVYAGNLSASTTPNSAQQRWTVELYKCDNGGTPIASGVTGAVVGSLGVTVITILDSGLLTLADGSVTNVQVSGNLGGTGLSMLAGQRVRYHVSSEKVGTAASNITQSVYYGTSYNSFIDVTVPLNTNGITNGSLVDGETATDALNTLGKGLNSPVFYPLYKLNSLQGAPATADLNDLSLNVTGLSLSTTLTINSGTYTDFVSSSPYACVVYDGINYNVYTVLSVTASTITLDQPLKTNVTAGTFSTLYDSSTGIHLTDAGDKAYADNLFRYMNLNQAIKTSGKYVFYGHSWTTNWDESLVNRFGVNLVTAGGDSDNSIGKGRSGMTSKWGKYWFDTVVLPENPDYVFIEFDINDARSNAVGGAYDFPFSSSDPYGVGSDVSGRTTIEEWKDNINWMIKRCIDNNITPVIISPMVVNDNTVNSYMVKNYIPYIPNTNVDISGVTGLTEALASKPSASGGSGFYSLWTSNTALGVGAIYHTAGARVLIGTTTEVGTDKFQVLGAASIRGIVSATNRYNLNPTTQTNQMFSDGAVFTGGTVADIGLRNDSGRLLFACGASTVPKMVLFTTGGFSIGNTTDLGAGTLNVTGNVSTIAATTANHAVIKSQLDLKADLASPALTGNPTAPTATAGDNDTSIATTAFVNGIVSSGNYTPTLTNIANTTSLSNTGATYVKVGNLVTVYVGVQITPTASATTTRFSITLPINRATAPTAGIPTGSGSLDSFGGVTAYYSALVYTIATTTTVEVRYVPTTTGTSNANFSFQYSIL